MEKTMKKSLEPELTHQAFSIIKENGGYKLVTIKYNPNDTSKINLTKSPDADTIDVCIERFKLAVSNAGLFDAQ